MKNLIEKLSASNPEIKAKRAKRIAEDMFYSNRETIENLKEERRSLTRKKDSLNDIFPSSELSLLVVNDNFNAKEWERKNQEIDVLLIENEIQLEVANKRKEEWFGDEKPEDADA